MHFDRNPPHEHPTGWHKHTPLCSYQLFKAGINVQNTAHAGPHLLLHPIHSRERPTALECALFQHRIFPAHVSKCDPNNILCGCCFQMMFISAKERLALISTKSDAKSHKHNTVYFSRAGQNHIHAVYTQHCWQGKHQLYGHARCTYIYIYMVLAKPINKVSSCAH